MEPETRKAPIRFYEIDLLRFLAALSVVFFHYTFRAYAADKLSPVPFLELSRITRYGYLGVELFFMISGYVVLLSAQGKTIRQFFLSRVTRLYPAFWVACTLTFIVLRIWGTKAGETNMSETLHATFAQYAYNMTMLSEFLSIPAIDGVYWTLAYEILFYFIISLLIGYRLLVHVEWFLTAWLGYILIASIIPQTGLIPILLFLKWAPHFIAGMLFYLVQNSRKRFTFRVLLLILSYALCLQSITRDLVVLRQSVHAEYSTLVVVGIVSSFFILFALIVTRRLNLNRFTWLPVVGSLTYPLYLLHGKIAFTLWFRVSHLVNKYVLLTGTIILMLLAARLIHVLLEKPLSKWLGIHLNKWLIKLDQTAD